MTVSFHYRFPWPAAGIRQGEHKSSSTGDTGIFYGDHPLRDASEISRLSLRASAKDPFARWWVREYLHHATNTLWLLLDVSASMRTHGSCQTAAQLIRSASQSSHQIGDRLGVFSAASAHDLTLSCPPGKNLALANGLAARIQALPEQSKGDAGLDSTSGLLDAASAIGVKRSLVLLVSDFHGPDDHWEAVLQRMHHHFVVPVVVWNARQLLGEQANGLTQVEDAETGQTRTVWMRAGLRKKIRCAALQRQKRLANLFASHNLQPVWFQDGFDAALLTARFFGRANTANNALPVLRDNQPPLTP